MYLLKEKSIICAFILFKLEFLFDALCQVWLNKPSGSGKGENMKSLQTDKQIDRLQIDRRATGDQKSSAEAH